MDGISTARHTVEFRGNEPADAVLSPRLGNRITSGSVRVRILAGFEDMSFGPEQWQALLRAGNSDVVFLTWQWQRAWWECFRRESLLLILAERNGNPIALAPFFSDEGMIFFAGSGNSDYLDFIGDISDPEVLDALLRTAIENLPGFLGFRFYLVPDQSRTGALLRESAERLGLMFCEEDEIVAPALDLVSDPAAALAAANRKSLVRHERFFVRESKIEVHDLRHRDEIFPCLDEFFEQHISRCVIAEYPSLFRDATQRDFYKRLTELFSETDWLRFTRVDWQGRPIAFHFGFCYRGSYLWYKPSFAADLARHSPGEVLLRQLLLTAIGEGARVFDFGIGDEAFKHRFATQVNTLRTWGLYPQGTCTETGEGKNCE
jgi:CelD/BcsL family acetyltransferase involved in cellulose biosynthesis